MRFQYPELLHGGDYNPDQWMEQKETIWKEDMEYAKQAGINTLSIGIFSWAVLEPEDGVYDFGWMDEVMDNLAANGIKAVLATPSGARPPWMAKKYPSVLRMTPERLPQLYGDRHNACYSSPDYERKVTEMNTRLAERYKDHPALMLWHISNEYNNDCHCPRCQERFREWLKARYGTIENLNRCWWTGFWAHRYNSFDEIESPSPIGDSSNTALNLAWKRFNTDNLIRFFKTEIEPLRRITPNVPITTNLMYLFDGLDYFRLGRELDIASWDNYPTWKGDDRDLITSNEAAFNHDIIRGVCEQKPFLLMESSPSSVNWQPINRLRMPGTLMYQSLQAISHGSDSVQYFQFRAGRGGSEQYHGAVIERFGTNTTRAFREVSEVGAALKKLKPVAGSVTRNRIAVLYDINVRWALDDASLLHKNKQKYVETVQSFHSTLSLLGYGVDIVDETCDISHYDVFIAPMAYMVREGFGEKVKSFVENGGIFLTTYVSGYVNEELLTYLDADPCPLNAITGIHADECDALDSQTFAHFDWNGKTYLVKEMAEVSHTTTAETLAVYSDRFYAGSPCLTVNQLGKGKAYYLAVRTEEEFLHDLLKSIIPFAPIAEEISSGVTVTERFGDDARYVFVHNPLHKPGKAVFAADMRDLLTGEVIGRECTMDALTIRVLTEA